MRASSISNQITKLLADNRISMTSWKFHIPNHITNENIGLVAQAKNLADGINYHIERKGIDIPESMLVSSSEWEVHIDGNGVMSKDGYNY
jgi:hypothetical protein